MSIDITSDSLVQGILVNYAELPDKFITSVLPFHFLQPLSDATMQRMYTVSKVYSKAR